MDHSEKLVETFLRAAGFTDVVYEPDGNVPPDFVADGRVAVEVRRLNQNYNDGTGNGTQGLEEVAIPLWRRIRDYLWSFPPSANGRSWYVTYRFSRPLPKWKDLKAQLDAVLNPFIASADPQPFEKKLEADFWIRVYPCPLPKPTFFRPIGHSDEQSGGDLIGEIRANLSHCVTEKTSKVQAYRPKYSEWWLVLPDYVGFGLDDFEQELFLDEGPISPGDFDRVVLLDPRDPARSFVVYP
jgi:hypothetical protein